MMTFLMIVAVISWSYVGLIVWSFITTRVGA